MTISKFYFEFYIFHFSLTHLLSRPVVRFKGWHHGAIDLLLPMFNPFYCKLPLAWFAIFRTDRYKTPLHQTSTSLHSANGQQSRT